MNRRGFLRALAGAAVVATDPEALLWTPGRKLISIPKARAPLLFSEEAMLKMQLDSLRGLYFHRDAFVLLYDPLGRPVFPARGPKIGDTVNVRVPPRFHVAVGRGRLS